MRCKTEQEGSGRLPKTPRKRRHPPGIGRSPQGPRPAARRGVRQMTVQAVGASRPLDRIRLTAINPSGALRKHGAPPAFFTAAAAAVVAAARSEPPPPPKPPPSTTGKTASSSPAHEAPAHSKDPSSSYIEPPTAPTAQSGNTRAPYSKSDSAEVSYPRFIQRSPEMRHPFFKPGVSIEKAFEPQITGM